MVMVQSMSPRPRPEPNTVPDWPVGTHYISKKTSTAVSLASTVLRVRNPTDDVLMEGRPKKKFRRQVSTDAVLGSPVKFSPRTQIEMDAAKHKTAEDGAKEDEKEFVQQLHSAQKELFVYQAQPSLPVPCRATGLKPGMVMLARARSNVLAGSPTSEITV